MMLPLMVNQNDNQQDFMKCQQKANKHRHVIHMNVVLLNVVAPFYLIFKIIIKIGLGSCIVIVDGTMTAKKENKHENVIHMSVILLNVVARFILY
jgi:hypothetical protein